jgi:hypothetical protein
MTAAVASDEPSTARLPLWREHAIAVDFVPDDALTLHEVAAQTGLKTRTIMTAVLSDAHGQRSVLHRISRPAYDHLGVPYWTSAQVADYFERSAARYDVREEFRALPTIDETEAVKRQVTSLRGLQRLSTVPLGTLHRWKVSPGFPAPVALMEVDSPTPRLLYSWTDFKAYVADRRASWLADHPEVDLDDPAKVITAVLG